MDCGAHERRDRTCLVSIENSAGYFFWCGRNAELFIGVLLAIVVDNTGANSRLNPALVIYVMPMRLLNPTTGRTTSGRVPLEIFYKT